MINTSHPFGNPGNPFHEKADNIKHVVLFDPTRYAVAVMIQFMSRFRDEVNIEETSETRMSRTITFDCHGPYEPNLGLYLNEADMFLWDKLRNETREPARVTLGDLMVSGDIVNRWIRLSHPTGVSFGVTGVSQEDSKGDFEKWYSLTACINKHSEEVKADLWAETEMDGYGVCQLLVPERGQHFIAHYRALSTAIYRTHQKLDKAASARGLPEPETP